LDHIGWGFGRLDSVFGGSSFHGTARDIVHVDLRSRLKTRFDEGFNHGLRHFSSSKESDFVEDRRS
jgi:hypothetical protein